ncbi:acetaldehyde dehydrogenase (acetylating) [Alkaliphilus serpentinus]|uniref:Acetaldehyde dehydrogenase (Acetylating) n=1 Tax=Alkaliphilus serpentinus TaxID=1482731 RepID=A0A833HLB0_9FIRM|nr:acetaldehyde dehydrogenase (acetylating) [Alkaliphilus serpentinus]KAB3525603.1 acetaldehyde dehydrogenase (acetylating) [Alkaliphilus serpentinus]
MNLLYDDLASIGESRELIGKAKKAQEELALLSQEKIDKIVESMANKAEKAAKRLAKMAVEDTGFGRYEDKVIKNVFASRSVYNYIKDMKTVGILREDHQEKILEIATPVGIIAGLVPSTNPTSTTIFKALCAVKAGNTIIFSPHPSALRCTIETVRLLEEAAVEMGAPKNTIQCMTIPKMEGSLALMSHKEIALILATGGSGMVKAAYSSGTPALGVGPGNVPAYIERSADIPLAVKRIFVSKTFDNGTICASEQAIVVDAVIENEVSRELENQGGFFVVGEDRERLSRFIQKSNGGLNPKIVGQPATKIAEMAGIKVPVATKVLICDEKGVGKEYPFSMEKLSPILGFYVEEDWHKACERCIELLNFGGLGHSLVIHSNNEEVIREFALKKPVNRILVNTPSSHGAIGATTNLPPSLTLGCGTIGGSSTSDNVNPMHLINVKRLVYGVKEAEDLSEEKSQNPDVDVEIITKIVMEELSKIIK